MSTNHQMPSANKTASASGEQDMHDVQLKRFSTGKLFGNATAVLISHLGDHYMLSITKQKKLLLTKIK